MGCFGIILIPKSSRANHMKFTFNGHAIQISKYPVSKILIHGQYPMIQYPKCNLHNQQINSSNMQTDQQNKQRTHTVADHQMQDDQGQHRGERSAIVASPCGAAYAARSIYDL